VTDDLRDFAPADDDGQYWIDSGHRLADADPATFTVLDHTLHPARDARHCRFTDRQTAEPEFAAPPR
jgi:hypothetical protein